MKSISRRSVVLGIDPSIRSTGICFHDVTNNYDKLYRILPKDKSAVDGERFTSCVYSLDKIISENAVGVPHRETDTTIVIENYAGFQNKGGRVVSRAELIGAYKYFLMDRFDGYCSIVLVGPTSLKSFAVGKGKASKPDMYIHAKMNHGYRGRNQDDMVDAFLLTRYWLAITNGAKLAKPKVFF